MAEEKKELSLQKGDAKALSSYVTDGKVMGMEDFTPPEEYGYLKIDHDTGKIVYSLTEEAKKSWDIVLLDWGFSRVMFSKDLDATDPLCKTEKKQKVRGLLKGAYGFCETCEYSQWKDKTKPDCGISINFIALLGGEKTMPITLQMRGTSFKPGMAMLNAFDRAQRPLFSSVLTLTTEARKRGSNTYYVFELTEKELLPKEQVDQFAKMYVDLKANENKEPEEIDMDDVNAVAKSLGAKVEDETPEVPFE